MSTNKDVFPNSQAIQHLLARFGDVFEGWTRSQQGTKGAETGLLLEAWGTGAYKNWIWKNVSQPWTHWVTIRTHQALNHISWGWELLYSCLLMAVHPLLLLWIFLLSCLDCFSGPLTNVQVACFYQVAQTVRPKKKGERVWSIFTEPGRRSS